MNWTTYLTICAQIAIGAMVLRFVADMVRGAITGEAPAKGKGAGESVRDLVAKARARAKAKDEDARLVTVPIGKRPASPVGTADTEVIEATDVTGSRK